MLRVQKICKIKGITLAEVAGKMGITYNSLYKIINGNPSINKIKEIAKILSVDYLLLLEDEQYMIKLLEQEQNEIEFYIKYRGTEKKIIKEDIIKLL
jgi:transcriptional regulator with XRE-family HTH domain